MGAHRFVFGKSKRNKMLHSYQHMRYLDPQNKNYSLAKDKNDKNCPPRFILTSYLENRIALHYMDIIVW